MNLFVDVTNMFDRGPAGTVFPLTRAASMGYAFGDRRFDDGDCAECSVCKQIAPDCQVSMFASINNNYGSRNDRLVNHSIESSARKSQPLIQSSLL